MAFFLFRSLIELSTCRVEKEVGLAHEKKFISSVEIETADMKLFMLGDEKSRVREAESSAASMMIHSLVESEAFHRRV